MSVAVSTDPSRRLRHITEAWPIQAQKAKPVGKGAPAAAVEDEDSEEESDEDEEEDEEPAKVNVGLHATQGLDYMLQRCLRCASPRTLLKPSALSMVELVRLI